MRNAGMASPLRIDLARTWYYVMNRGGTLYRTDADQWRFLGSVGALPERFGLKIQAFVLMDNHSHLLDRTRLSRDFFNCIGSVQS